MLKTELVMDDDPNKGKGPVYEWKMKRDSNGFMIEQNHYQKCTRKY